MMEFAIAMGQLSVQLEVSRMEAELGRSLTSEEYREVFNREFGRCFEAGVEAGVASDMAVANLNRLPPIWIKPAIVAGFVFVLTLAVMLS